jgi:hypothetical protein
MKFLKPFPIENGLSYFISLFLSFIPSLLDIILPSKSNSSYLLLVIHFIVILSFTSGKHIWHEFKVGYMCGSPDGVRVCHILGVNGKFPGPTIEGTVGDTLHVTVHNQIEDKEGFQKTAIH